MDPHPTDCALSGTERLLRCRECRTVFESDVADPNQQGEPRCPQCFLSSAEPVTDLDARELVIRHSTPFR